MFAALLMCVCVCIRDCECLHVCEHACACMRVCMCVYVTCIVLFCDIYSRYFFSLFLSYGLKRVIVNHFCWNSAKDIKPGLKTV